MRRKGLVHTQCGNFENSLSPKKFFREIKSLVTYLVKPLLSRNFRQKSVRENLRNFHTVYYELSIIIYSPRIHSCHYILLPSFLSYSYLFICFCFVFTVVFNFQTRYRKSSSNLKTKMNIVFHLQTTNF